MKHNLETFKQQFEKMPLYGKLREHDKRLTYGQYLTVLKEWWDKTKREAEGFEKELREILEKEKGMVTLNDDDSTKDVLIGVKEILGK